MSSNSHEAHYIGTNKVDNLYSQDNDFWETYMKARPNVPQSWFDRIFEYHEQNGGKFDVVHDAGAGAGIHSQRLAQRFKKVIVSDPSEQNIGAAKKLLKGPQFEFHVEKLEESSLPGDSVDMIVGATMIHWTNLEGSLRSVEKQLKPNGTFVIWHAAFPRMPSDPSVETVWDNLIHNVISNMGHLAEAASQGTPGPESVRISGRAYDYIRLSEDVFKPGVQRIKINDDESAAEVGGIATQAYLLPEIREWFYSRVPSRVGEHDKMTFEDGEEWSFDADIDKLKAIYQTYPADYESEQLAPLVAKVKEVMPPGKTIRARWHVYALMASKK